MSEQNYAAWRDARIARLLKQDKFDFYDLCDVIVILRGEGGCPWDREQDHHSIRKGLIEECYEVVEAIDREDSVLMREELGDVLLQIVFHADMEKDAGRFDIGDVIHDECVKMIHRHPHVFGHVKADTSDDVLRNWEIIKAEEKQRVSLADQLHAIPPMLPALMRAQKVGKKVKLNECPDLARLTSDMAAQLNDLNMAETMQAKEILGKILFQMTTVSACLGIEAEEALFEETQRVIRQFTEEEH